MTFGKILQNRVCMLQFSCRFAFYQLFVTMHSVTDRQTDDMMMPIADHSV